MDEPTAQTHLSTECKCDEIGNCRCPKCDSAIYAENLEKHAPPEGMPSRLLTYKCTVCDYVCCRKRESPQPKLKPKRGMNMM